MPNAGKNSREKAIGELKRLMEEQKARLDPGLLAKAQAAAAATAGSVPGGASLDALLAKAMSRDKAPAKDAPGVPKPFDGVAGLLPPQASSSSSVPFDRQSARRAVELFLRQHRDRPGFERRLALFLQAKGK